MSKERALAWSYGGGTQSVAIAVLIANGELSKPEHIVIADTGREKSYTWRYTEEYVKPLLATCGLEIHVASHDLSKVDLYSKNGDLLIPAFTKKGGKLPTFCSTEWKLRVIRRHLRNHGYSPKNPVKLWIGISLDEVGRAKPSDRKWVENAWPLLYTRPTTRVECIKIVEDAGLPVPPRSSCWMCPHHRNDEWQRMREQDPDDFAKAVQLEKEVQEKDAELFLHRSLRPISVLPFLEPEKDSADLFGGVDACDSGHCFI
jgi:hypothetical protein